MHFSGFLAAALVATVTALPTGEVKAQAQTQTQDPQVAGYGIRPVGQYYGVAQLVEKKARNKRGVTLLDVWYGKYNPYAEYSTYKSYPPGAEGAEGQAPEMKRDAAMETV